MTTTQLDAPLARAATTGVLPRLVTDTRYVVTGFPLALATFTVCVTGFVVGLGLAVLWIGVPMMVAAMLSARRVADAERVRIAAVLGEPVPVPPYRTPIDRSTAALTPTRQRLATLADPQHWRDLAHAAVRLIPSTIAFSFVVSWWAGMLGSLTWSMWGWALPNGADDRDLPELLGFGEAYGTAVVFYLVVAVLLAITLPAVARSAALFEARIARALLSPSGRHPNPGTTGW